MTRIRIGEEILEISDLEWPHWVRAGRVPPDALILSAQWTKGTWRRAGDLEVYYLYLPPPAETAAPKITIPRHGPFGLFRGRGLAVTEALIALNVGISAALVLGWGAAHYEVRLWAFSASLRNQLRDGGLHVLLIPLFLHASLQHLLSNMLSLLGAGALIEEFYGRGRMFALYLGSGLIGALLSLFRTKEVLSVGASGAIFGLYGVALLFFLRERRRFSFRWRWKTLRVYLPFLALIVAPAIFNADLLSHVGGFLGGVLIALFIRPLPARLPVLEEPAAALRSPLSLGS